MVVPQNKFADKLKTHPRILSFDPQNKVVHRRFAAVGFLLLKVFTVEVLGDEWFFRMGVTEKIAGLTVSYCTSLKIPGLTVFVCPSLKIPGLTVFVCTSLKIPGLTVSVCTNSIRCLLVFADRDGQTDYIARHFFRIPCINYGGFIRDNTSSIFRFLPTHSS